MHNVIDSKPVIHSADSIIELRRNTVFECESPFVRDDGCLAYGAHQFTNNGGQSEKLYLAPDLVFSIESNRALPPVHVGVKQKGYLRLICILEGAIQVTGANRHSYLLQSNKGLLTRYGEAPVVYENKQAQTYSAIELICSVDTLSVLLGLPIVASVDDSADNIFAKHSSTDFSQLFDLDESIIQLLLAVMKPSADTAFLRQLYLRAKLMDLVFLVFRQLHNNHLEVSHQDSGFHPLIIERLNRVRQAIEQGIDNPPSINELCSLVGYNENKLTTGFKQLFGNTPHQYGLNYRLASAHYLLKTSHDTVSEVAHKIGYKEANSFSRAFRSRYGKSPRQV